MKSRFVISWLLVLFLSLLPSLAFISCYWKHVERDSMNWTAWQQMASTTGTRNTQDAPFLQSIKSHLRTDLVRQIWFRPLENGSSLYLKANQSQILLEPSSKGLKATEHFTDMEAGFQDIPLWNPALDPKNMGSDQSPQWILRVIESKQAHFDYARQLLTADQVDVRLYRLRRPLDFTRHPLPGENLANLRGYATKIYLDCKSRPPHFKAIRFKASVQAQP